MTILLYQRLPTVGGRNEAGPAGRLTIEEIAATEALEALRSEWAALWSRCPAATPFQHPAWLLAWWRHFGGAELMTVALRWTDRLVGLAPLFLWHRPDTRERVGLLMGTGLTDYVDALFEPGYEESGAAAVFDYLHTSRHRWDVCQFEQLREASPLHLQPIPAGWSEDVEVQSQSPVLAWSVGDQRLDGAIPAGHIRKLRYYRRRTEKEGRVEVEEVTADNFDRLFDALLYLHGARWRSKGKEGMLVGKQVQRFHREAARGLLRTGVLRLYAMRLNGKAVAVYYGMLAHGRAYYYLSGFDPAYPVLSLGTQIVGYAIEQGISEGAMEFDFLRGQEDYKYAWGATDRRNYRRRLFHRA